MGWYAVRLRKRLQNAEGSAVTRRRFSACGSPLAKCDTGGGMLATAVLYEKKGESGVRRMQF